MSTALADFIVLVVLVAFIGVCLLVLRASWRLLDRARRSAPPRPRLPPPPDDWDDVEYSARHHH